MNVLIACEESQEVCKAFRKKGHNAFSCDVQECSGGFPEWHILDNCLNIINGHCIFFTQDGNYHEMYCNWDLIIAHPPCTFLTVTGNRWFNVNRYGQKAINRIKERDKSIDFFMKFVNLNCKKIAIENPIGYMSTFYRKPDQIIQPYYFGHKERKSTCLWLKGLNKLIPTNIVEPVIIKYKNNKGTDNPWHMNTLNLSPKERAKIRSKTFPGIAAAMAEQWG